MNDDARILLTAVYDRLALSIEGDACSEEDLADLARLFVRVGRRLGDPSAGPSAGDTRPGSHPAPSDEIFPVDVAGTTKMVRRSSVRWVEAQGDYARLHTAEGSYLIRVPLTQLAARWAGAGFLRIHRSYIVAVALITEVRTTNSGYTVRLGTGDNTPLLPVSRRYSGRFRDRLRATRLKKQRG